MLRQPPLTSRVLILELLADVFQRNALFSHQDADSIEILIEDRTRGPPAIEIF